MISSFQLPVWPEHDLLQENTCLHACEVKLGNRTAPQNILKHFNMLQITILRVLRTRPQVTTSKSEWKTMLSMDKSVIASWARQLTLTDFI